MKEDEWGGTLRFNFQSLNESTMVGSRMLVDRVARVWQQ